MWKNHKTTFGVRSVSGEEILVVRVNVDKADMNICGPVLSEKVFLFLLGK